MLRQKDKENIIKTLQSCKDFGNINDYYKNLVILGENFKKNKKLQIMTKILEALGSEDRLYILHALSQQDRCVCELEAILQKSQPAVSHHLKILEKAHLIRGWKKGKFTHYSLSKQHFDKFNELIEGFFEGVSNWFGEIAV